MKFFFLFFLLLIGKTYGIERSFTLFLPSAGETGLFILIMAVNICNCFSSADKDFTDICENTTKLMS